MTTDPPQPPNPPATPPPATPPPQPGSPGGWGGGSPPATPPYRRLARRRENKVLGGVCSGVAHQLGVDPVIVRIVAVALAFTGWGLLLYLLGWLALPEEQPDGTIRPASTNPGWPWLPICVAVCLAFALPAGFGFVFGHGPDVFPMLILFGFGFMIWKASRGRSRHHHRTHGHRHHGGWHGPPPAPGTPPAPPQASGPWVESDWGQSRAEPGPPTATGGPGTGAAVPEWARPDAGSPPAAATPVPAPPGVPEGPEEDPLLAEARRISDPLQTEPYLFETAPYGPAPVPAPPPRRRRWGRGILTVVILLVLGVVAFAGAMGPDEDGFPVAAAVLVLIGGALIVGGLRGRGRWLAFPGLAVLGLLSIGSAFSFTVEGGAGDRIYQPASLRELQDSYRLGLGELTVDLSDVDFPAGRPVDLEVDLGAGELLVIVPDDVTVDVTAEAGAGALNVFDETADGVGDVDLAFVERGDAEGGGRLNLDASVSLGELTVERAGDR